MWRSIGCSPYRCSARGEVLYGGGPLNGLGSAPLHLRPRDDVVRSVGPADPRLVPAVVVLGQKDQRRGLSQCGAGLGPLRVQPSPDADEWVVLQLVADCGRLGVARMDAG